MTTSAPAQLPARSPVLHQQFLCASNPLPVEKNIRLTMVLTVCREVIVKLLAFTFAMIVGPIGSYFLTVNTLFKGRSFPRFHSDTRREFANWSVWKGNSTYAGALAAIMANVVLVGYVIVAMKEDQSDRLEEEKKKDK